MQINLQKSENILAYVQFLLYLCSKIVIVMRRISFIIAVLACAMSAMAQERMSFVIEGSEQEYNQIRVVNRTSEVSLHCRVVTLNADDEITSVYGEYTLDGYEDSDSNTSRIQRGTKLGIQLPEDFGKPLSFSVEYKDYPIFDVIIIYLRDGDSRYSDTF